MESRLRLRPFVVRELKTDAELQACLALERAYVTDYVWQMEMRDEGEDPTIRFRTVRLPRAVRVEYPRAAAELTESWKRRDCFLIAATEDVIMGFVHMYAEPSKSSGWIRDLIVGEAYRRRRIGSALLEQTARWALLHHIRHITLEMQTKNYPAIAFARSHGFVFCGYNDRYYSNGDIALFFDSQVL